MTNKTVSIKKIEINSENHLQVYPNVDVCGSLEFIYRDASGIRWDAASQSLIAAEPSKWDIPKLFEQMIKAVNSEYGYKLSVNSETSWVNIPNELKHSITQNSWSG